MNNGSTRVLRPPPRNPTMAAIQIQTIDYCNRVCSFCPNHFGTRKTRQILPLELLDTILDQLADIGFAGRISPFLQNEPLSDPRLPNLIRRIRTRFPENLIVLNTNGDRLAERDVRKDLSECGIDAIQINCYDGKREFEETKRLLARWAEECNGIQLHHHGTFRDLHVRNGGANVWCGWVPRAQPAFWNRGGSVPHVAPARPSWEYPFCNLPFKQMYINYRGQAILCCGDWSFEVVMGTIGESSIRSIWSSERYEHYRSRLRLQRNTELPLCRDCNRVRHPDSTHTASRATTDIPPQFRTSRFPGLNAGGISSWQVDWNLSPCNNRGNGHVEL